VTRFDAVDCSSLRCAIGQFAICGVDEWGDLKMSMDAQKLNAGLFDSDRSVLIDADNI
jgi:hypothetical protein